MTLLQFMAKACCYAQEHIDDAEAWSIDETARETLLQCTSHQIACFLAQNTVFGKEGVESEVISKPLYAHPRKSEDEWTAILRDLIKELGGYLPKPASLRESPEDAQTLNKFPVTSWATAGAVGVSGAAAARLFRIGRLERRNPTVDEAVAWRYRRYQ